MNIITRKIYKETGEYVSRCGITDKKSIVLINEFIGGLHSKNLINNAVDIFLFGDRFNRQDKTVVESVLNYGGGPGTINGSLVSWTEEGIETIAGTDVTFSNYTYNNPSTFALVKATGPNPASSASCDQLIVWTNTSKAWNYRFFRFGQGDTGGTGNCIFQSYSNQATDYRHTNTILNYTGFAGIMTFFGADFHDVDPTTRTIFNTNSVTGNDETVLQHSYTQVGWSSLVFSSLAGDAQGKYTIFIILKNTIPMSNYWQFLKDLSKDTVARDLSGIAV